MRNLSRMIVLLIAGFGAAHVQETYAAIPNTERQALLNLYASTNGVGWSQRTGWTGAAGGECNWFGITCDNTQSHVIDIELAGNNLTGTLPALADLSGLETLDVSSNQLTGSIPPLTELTNLWNFYAYHNQLSGSIPALAGMTQLGYFYVYDNKLSGAIPDLTSMPTLCHFNVSRNQLTGSIPALTQLTALVLFDVDTNQLSGNIPALTGLSSLSLFNVGGNQLTGTVPAAPNPNSLVASGSGLCPNPLTITTNTDWNEATGFTPWQADPHSNNVCDDLFTGDFE